MLLDGKRLDLPPHHHTNPHTALSAMRRYRSENRNIKDITSGDAKDSVPGKVDYYCMRVHENVPKFKAMTLKELQVFNANESQKAEFEGWREGVIESIKRSGRVSKFSLSKQDVQLYDSSFDRSFVTGIDYTLEKFKVLARDMPDLRRRAKPYEKRFRDGTVKQLVRVYDQEEGCMRFEEGQQAMLSHRKEVFSDDLELDKGHAIETYERCGNVIFGDSAKRGVLRAADLGLAQSSTMMPAAPAVAAQAGKPNSKEEQGSNSEGSDSDSSDEDGDKTSSDEEEDPLSDFE